MEEIPVYQAIPHQVQSGVAAIYHGDLKMILLRYTNYQSTYYVTCS